MNATPSSPTFIQACAQQVGKRLFAAPDRFTPLGWGLIGLLIVLLLLPLLGYPLGPDNGLFFVAGRKIIHQGAVPYRDIVDVKPPLIYYLNALAILLFGDNPISIRILDLLLQLVTCALLARLVRRASGSDMWAATSAILYAVMYIALSFSNVSQVESFVGLFLLPAVSLFLFRRTVSSFFLIGLLCGVMTFFKFTFGIALAAFLLGDLLLYNDPWKKRLRNYAAMGTGYCLLVVLFILYLLLLDGTEGFRNMQQFLSGYTGLQWASKGTLLRETLEQIPTSLADNYSLAMLLGTVVGIGGAAGGIRLRGWKGADEAAATGEESETKREREKTATLLLRLCTIFFVFLFGTIALEAKWIHYHLLRVFSFGAILGGYGLLRIVGLMARREMGRFRLVSLGLTLTLLIAFSPLTRYVYHSRPVLMMLKQGPVAFDRFYASAHVADGWTMEEMQKIGAFIRKNRKEGEKLFIISGVGGMLYLQCDYVPDVGIFHSCFLISSFGPQKWRDTTTAYLLAEQPRFFVVHQGDHMPAITGTERTSAETIRQLMPDVQKMLDSDYAPVLTTTSFIVYEKLDSGEPTAGKRGTTTTKSFHSHS